jgi:arginyl-tRNA synthetase
MSILRALSDLVGDAFARAGLDRALGEVVVSQRPELADYQCNGALAAAKTAGRSPRELAAEIAGRIEADPRLAGVEVAGPGFLNLRVSDGYLAEMIEQIHRDERRSIDPVGSPLSVVVDYAGPNVAKAMHVGHIRATIIGDALARLFAFLGHRVTRDPHFGDWGYQMGLLIAAIEDEQPDLPYFGGAADGYPAEPPVTLEDLQRIYPQAAERARGDETFGERARRATVALQQGDPGYRALWRQMKAVSLESQQVDFADLGVEFDLWYGESDVRDRIEPMIDRMRRDGVVEESRGAEIVRVAQPDDKKELPPLILTTSVGGFLYSTTDLATIEMRVEDLGADLILYVVDARQSDHFEQVFRAARLAGVAPDHVALEHIKFGTMNGPDGKPFKTREGGVVRLRDLIDMVRTAAARRLDEAEIAADYPPEERAAIAHAVGIAALKFADLINNRTSDYIFDLDRFTSFEGKTGPYLQYGAVRMSSILRNADERGIEAGAISVPAVEPERALVLELLRLPEIVNRAAELRAPNHLAEYAFNLTGAFNRFYDACHILSEPDVGRRASWLGLVEATRSVLGTTLDLLGITVPERM